jgi:hypothetical protein
LCIALRGTIRNRFTVHMIWFIYFPFCYEWFRFDSTALRLVIQIVFAKTETFMLSWDEFSQFSFDYNPCPLLPTTVSTVSTSRSYLNLWP